MTSVIAELVERESQSFGLYEFAALPRENEQIVIWHKAGLLILTVQQVEHDPCKILEDGEYETIAASVKREKGPKITLLVKKVGRVV